MNARVERAVPGIFHLSPALVLFPLALAAGSPVRFEGGFGPFKSLSVLDLVLAASAPLLLLFAAQRRAIDVGDRTVFGCLTLPAVVSLLSFAWTSDLDASIRGVIAYGEALVAYLLVVNLVPDGCPARIRRFLLAFAFSLLLSSALMYLQVPAFKPQIGITPDAQDILTGYYARFGNPFLGASNNVAGLLAFWLLLMLAVRRSSWTYRWLLAAGTLALVLTLSRGVIAALIACIPIAAILAGRIRFRTAVLVLVAIGALGMAAAGAIVFSETARDNLAGRFTLDTFLHRAELLREIVAAVGERPLLGWGGGAAPPYAPWLAGSAHNAYLEQAMYFGVPLAAAITVCLLVLPARIASAYGPVSRNPVTRLVTLALICQLLVFTTQTSFEGLNLKIIFYAFTGLGLVLARAQSRSAK